MACAGVDVLLVVVLAALLVAGSASSASSAPASRRHLSQFIAPTIKGLPVDYCLRYELVHYGPDNALVSKHGQGCGKPAADEFCARQGFKEGSEYFTAMYYAHNATYVQGDDSINPADTNMGHGEHTFFSNVSCVLPPPPQAPEPTTNLRPGPTRI